MINHNYKFVWIHVPKTAGTSMNTMLKRSFKMPWSECPGRVGNVPGYKWPHLPVEKQGYMRHYVPPVIDSDGKYEYSDYFTFTCVRNPWDRLTSAYRFWGLSKMKSGKPRYKVAFQSTCHDKFKTFETFVRHFKRDCPNSIWEHVVPDLVPEQVHGMTQYEFLMQRVGDIDNINYIIRYESIHQQIQELSKKLNHRLIKLPNQNGTKRFKQHSDYRNYYTPETREIVAKYYEQDIETFKYSF